MLSIRHKFLFIHIPKTAGNSIQRLLSPYSEDHIVITRPAWQDGEERFGLANPNLPNIHKHSTLADYKEVMEPPLFEKVFKFTIVRNPWDRIVSYYFHSRYNAVKMGRLAGEAEVLDRSAFIRHINRISPAMDFISLEGKGPSVDYVIRFEELEKGWRELCDKISVPYRPLPWHNRGEARGKYANYYDRETRKLVRRRFREEIEYFGYDF